MANVRRIRRTRAARRQAVHVPAAVQEPAGGARAKRGSVRREGILAAALEEFSAHGFEAARLDDVARRAGIAKGTIYLYFSDKETLFQELVRSEISPIVGTLEHVTQIEA